MSSLDRTGLAGLLFADFFEVAAFFPVEGALLEDFFSVLGLASAAADWLALLDFWLVFLLVVFVVLAEAVSAVAFCLLGVFARL